jgi:hypothetical protein
MRLEIDCYHNERNKIGNTGYFIYSKLNDSLKNNHPSWYDYYWTNIDGQLKPELAAVLCFHNKSMQYNKQQEKKSRCTDY